jgi:O-antigen ligase
VVKGSLGFVLFVILIGVLFVRPAELIDSLKEAPVYEVTILCCLAVAAPAVLAQLRPDSLRDRPITLCVLCLLPAVALSHLSHFALPDAKASAIAFSKIVLSYLLLVAVVDTGARLRQLLGWMTLFILALTILALLQHHGIIDNPALAAHRERVFDSESGDVVGMNVRLCGAGIFANPNDLSRILAVGIALCLYFVATRRSVLLIPFWIAAAGLFGYALILTMSRGGLMGLVVTLAVLFYARFGARKAIVLMGLLAVAAGALGGRQTELSTSEGTGQQRIRLWSEGLTELRSSPLFGVGMDNYAEATGTGLAAHNSFIHAYVELGFLGGTLFLGAFYCALRMSARMGHHDWCFPDPELVRLRPYILAILAGYVTGMLSSSRCYAIPTYMLLGLATVYLRLATAHVPLPSFQASPSFAWRLIGVSVACFTVISLYVLAFASFGSKVL